MKTCSKCGEEKNLESFFKDRAFKDGHSSICKVCKKAATARWRDRNREKWNAYMREFRAEHPLSIKDKAHKRNRVMRCRYGIRLGKYDEMLLAQQNKCPICCRSISELNKPLVVDHCHKTKKVRGLLCFSCNRSLAIIDNPTLLSRAIEYISGKLSQ